MLFTDGGEFRPINGIRSEKLAHNIINKTKSEILVVINPLSQKHTKN